MEGHEGHMMPGQDISSMSEHDMNSMSGHNMPGHEMPAMCAMNVTIEIYRNERFIN
jgi:hypothetical protein